MSDMDSMYEADGSLLGLDTQEKRERWLRFLVESSTDWVDCQMVYDDRDDLVLRVRWPDGEEVAFDCKITRRVRIVLPEEERVKN